MTEAPFAGRFPIYIGDDQTDLAGFEAVSRVNGMAIAVGPLVAAPWWVARSRGGARVVAQLPGTGSLSGTPDLNLAVIGNCQIAALIDASGSIVWACLPRLDGGSGIQCVAVTGRGYGTRRVFSHHAGGGAHPAALPAQHGRGGDNS